MRYILVLLLLVVLNSCKPKDKDTEHAFTNNLIHETSPYLLQHAHNPVNWQAWSDAALTNAKKENKLVLVSIGYSSCHWCHVMEEETFEDESVAELMNANFINIKVDREERPDIDQIYQTAIGLVSGSGGWPLNAIILPNGKPIYLGTYHSKEQWQEVLSKLSTDFKSNASKMEEYADMLAQGIADQNSITPLNDFTTLTKINVETSIVNWGKQWDVEWGGDQNEIKFPTPTKLNFLLDYVALSGDEAAKNHLKLTLDKMALGGIYDQIGGGFFRYSTDDRWKVPHFEKMLYDNAQLIAVYAKAHKLFKDDVYANVVKQSILFLNREMKNPEGGYFAAIDADSEGEEGKYYTWTKTELKAVIKDDFDLFSAYYTINDSVMWEDKFVFHKLFSDAEFRATHNLSKKELHEKIEGWRKKLLLARSKRIAPKKDDKIITSWNAQLINGFLEAYKALGNETFKNDAIAIFDFVNSVQPSKNELIHSYKKGGKHVSGFLDDYAFMSSAALNLYSTTLSEAYVNQARTWVEIANTHFKEADSGFYTYKKDNDLISKIIKVDDGIYPSANAVLAHALLKLGHIDYNVAYLTASKKMLATMVPSVVESVQNYSHWGSLLLNNAYPYFEIAVVGANALAVTKELQHNYVPNALIVGSPTANEKPLFKGRYDASGTYIYVCRDNTCKLPVKNTAEALQQMVDF